MLGQFGDVATELLVRIDGDEGLFRAYDSVNVLAPVYAWDNVEAEGVITAVGKTSRKMAFEARKVIRSAPEVNDSAAEVLDPPAGPRLPRDGNCVTPKGKQRRG